MTDRELMQMALDALEQCVSTCLDQYSHEQVMSRPEHFMNQAMGALRARLAQPEQEPVAWMVKQLNRIPQFFEGEKDAQVLLGVDESKVIPLYTAPPQREWQTLTDEEMFSLWVRCPAETEDRFAFARAIEQALKEKNT